MTSAPTCGSCNWEMKQCGSAGDQCRNGACVVRAPQLGGSCTINWDCAKGECWRGPAASGAACREWVVFARLATRRRSSAGRASPAAQAALGSVGCRSRRAAIFAPPTPTVRRRLARPCATGSAGLWEPPSARCKSVVAAGAGCAREWQPRPDVFACMADWNSYRCADVPPVVIRWGRVRGRQQGVRGGPPLH